MDQQVRARLTWVSLFEEIGNAGVVCRRCGISRPTLRKWVRRYEILGLEGLESKSRRPKHSPNQKIFEHETELILYLRDSRRLGARRIQCELMRQYDCSLSLASIHKVLCKHSANTLPPRHRQRKGNKRYSRPVPGERIQMDPCKIAPGLYQYTAVDDCTRVRALALYPRRTASNSIKFLDKVIEETPFPVQRIQTDRGGEFFAYKFQERLLNWGIKFRPIGPWSPYLNGKVERSQRTDLEEFWETVNLDGKVVSILLCKMSNWM